MFWKKNSAGDSTLQLRNLSESPPMPTLQTDELLLADIDPPMEHKGRHHEKKSTSPHTKPTTLDPCNLPQRRYFCPDEVVLSRGKTCSLEGKPKGPRFTPKYAFDYAYHSLDSSLCEDKLSAKFKNYSSGYYSLHWKVKATNDFNIPNGLHFVVNVKYDTEPDISGTMDVIMPAHRLSILEAEIQVVLRNNENTRRYEYFGLVVEHVEIKPIALRDEIPAGVRKFVVKRAGIPNYSINTMKSLPTTLDSSYLPASTPVSRLVTSKSSRYLATLSLSQDVACIRIWDMSIVRNPLNPPTDMSKLYKTSASAIIHHAGVGNLPIGIAISPQGDQVAVFQEPRIGQWQEGSTVERAVFPFKLYNNPLVQQVSLIVNIDTPQTSNAESSVSDTYKDYDPGNTAQFLKSDNNYSASNTSGTSSDNTLLQEVHWTHSILESFIGFGGFVTEPKDTKEEKSDSNSGSDDGSASTVSDDGPAASKKGIRGCTFVACSGLYLDVYKISPEKKWSRSHTITLADLLPTLSRRISCKMMMDSLTSGTFMWLEDNGRSCTIWELMTGSNITHISCIENARFKGKTFRGHNMMAISPHESIVALASIDGSLTTYFSRTGMAIDDRKFPGYKIEYLGFHGQDDQLCVILRNSVTFELTAKILDTLQLKSEFDINQIPIPTIGSAVLAFFNVKGFWNRGIVCEADGAKINCYLSHQPQSGKISKGSSSIVIVEPTDVEFESLIDEQAQYSVVTAYHKELLPEGDGASYWVHRVELIEENLVARTRKLIFSFIPEPWMRAMTSDVVHPENLLSAYFMPCGTRFVVVGIQTLQIWNLPTHEHSKCSLQFFWSQPREGPDLWPGGIAYRSRRVRDYYVDTLNTTILVDTESDNTIAEIKVNDKQKKKSIPIPGPGTSGARLAIVHCFRSVHLLAAAYTFATREGQRVARLGLQHNFTFEDHAAAIVRFTHEHINRMMSINVYAPKKKGSSGPKNKTKPVKDLEPRREETRISPLDSSPGSFARDIAVGHNSNKRDEYDSVPQAFYDKNSPTDEGPGLYSKKGGVVTLLTLLLDHVFLLDQNHEFVQGLLNTSNGDWIPREDESLNPIRRAIEARNGPLVEAFIEYCIKNAKKYHPAYLMPAVQCLNDLSDRYPTILSDMFRRASYVPAHNHSYVASHAIIANHEYANQVKSYLSFWKYISGSSPYKKSNNINDFAKPVLHLRSQLPFRSSKFFHVLNIETSRREERQEVFPIRPQMSEEEERRKSKTDLFSHKIYVSPFPKLSMYGPYKGWHGILGDRSRSAFNEIAGQDYFDSPAMIATLEFKWHKFGFARWLDRFLMSFVFFILIVVLTAKQISLYSGEDGDIIQPEDFEARYMVEWRPVYWTTIGFGGVLLFMELLQFRAGPSKYLRSPYNWFDLAAYSLSIIGCFMFLYTDRSIDEDVGMDHGPHQIGIMSFAILFLYLNILFDLRVIRQLGIVVNIILNMARMIGYEYQDGFPRHPFAALSATYFFLAGRYDPLDSVMDGEFGSFHIMMVIYFFFTAILLLNILIALMNDGFNESKDEGELAWLKQWSEVISEIEIISMTSGDRQNSNYFPDYIYYGASEQEAELYESKYHIASKSNLSLENRFLVETVSMEQNATQLSQRAIQRDIQTVAREMDRLRQTQDEFNQDMAHLVELMAAYLAQTATVDNASEITSPIELTSSPLDQQELASSPQDEQEAQPDDRRRLRRRVPTLPTEISGSQSHSQTSNEFAHQSGTIIRIEKEDEDEDEEAKEDDDEEEAEGQAVIGEDYSDEEEPQRASGDILHPGPLVDAKSQAPVMPLPAPPMPYPVPLPSIQGGPFEPPFESTSEISPTPITSSGSQASTIPAQPLARPPRNSSTSSLPTRLPSSSTPVLNSSLSAPPPAQAASSQNSGRLPMPSPSKPSTAVLVPSATLSTAPAPESAAAASTLVPSGTSGQASHTHSLPPPKHQSTAPTPFGKMQGSTRFSKPTTTSSVLQHMLENRTTHVESPTSYLPS
ncbi:hypothetical protein BGZ94_001720, partial [Podila epigama]